MLSTQGVFQLLGLTQNATELGSMCNGASFIGNPVNHMERVKKPSKGCLKNEIFSTIFLEKCVFWKIKPNSHKLKQHSNTLFPTVLLFVFSFHLKL